MGEYRMRFELQNHAETCFETKEQDMTKMMTVVVVVICASIGGGYAMQGPKMTPCEILNTEKEIGFLETRLRYLTDLFPGLLDRRFGEDGRVLEDYKKEAFLLKKALNCKKKLLEQALCKVVDTQK